MSDSQSFAGYRGNKPVNVVLTGFSVLLASAFSLSVAASAPVNSAQMPPDFSQPQAGEHLPGGSASTRKKASRDLFMQPSGNMAFNKKLDFKLGNGIFRKLWVSSPSSTTASDGLGPLYNARSCMGCHVRDGRGHTPAGNWPEDNAISMLMRLSIPPQNEEQQAQLSSGYMGVIPEPTYGGQLQDFAVTGIDAEGRIHTTYTPVTVTLNGGEQVELRKPEYRVTDLSAGPLHPDTMLSVRIAPPMIGLGLLEAISEADILSWADPDDTDNNGISGRANRVWNVVEGKPTLGRYGWKAGNPTLDQQNNGAFNNDIGISTPMMRAAYGDCTEAQKVCRELPDGNTPAQDNAEASQQMIDWLLFYTSNLAVPVRPDAAKPEVLAGKQVFFDSGCADCHRPNYRTSTRADMPEQSDQLIWPYSDLLLHDMGDALADNRPEFAASGREWRTPPLWGIGYTKTVSEEAHYLHDGRARTLLEAVLWHGGEAEAAKQKVIAMAKSQRDNLITFLESL